MSGKIWYGSHHIIPLENRLDNGLSAGSGTPETRASRNRAENCPVCILLYYSSPVLTVTRRPDIPRPIRPLNLTAKLKDTANAAAPELSSQRKALRDFLSRKTQLAESDGLPPLSTNTASTLQNKRTFSSIASDSDAEDVDIQPKQCMFSSYFMFFLTNSATIYSHKTAYHTFLTGYGQEHDVNVDRYRLGRRRE